MPVRPWRIVLVDDDADCRNVLQLVVQEIFGPNAQVICASDGEEAYALLLEAPADLLLSDFNMPRLNGGELTSRLASDGLLQRLPVLILTGGIEAAHDPRLTQAGVRSILMKPFTIAQLRRSVLDVLGLPEATALPSSPDDAR